MKKENEHSAKILSNHVHSLQQNIICAAKLTALLTALLRRQHSSTYQNTSTQLSKHSLNHTHNSNTLGLLDIETFSGSVTGVYKDDKSQ
jgi:hypothetical protein